MAVFRFGKRIIVPYKRPWGHRVGAPSDFFMEFNNTDTGRQGEIQQWVVEFAGEYRITAYGAEGGYDSGNRSPAGKGAKISGIFELESGDVLRILVGQKGEDSGSSSGGQGGGGGSFVVQVVSASEFQMETDDSFVEPLVIAGGGMGSPDSSYDGAPDGRIDTRGHDYVSIGNSSSSGAGGGGSFSVDGGGDSNTKGFSFLSGGLGGEGTWSRGGFGGGGSKGGSFNDGAGGGGFDGGDHSYEDTYGGGGSYNNGSDQNNESGVQEGHGKVIIEAA